MAAMKNGQLATPALTAAPAVPVPTPDASRPAVDTASSDKTTRWIADRKGMNKMTVYPPDPTKPDQPVSERLGLVFERSGFCDWKLTEFRMAAAALSK